MERFDGLLATRLGQKYPCVWVGANTRDGDFWPTTYYPYLAEYLQANCVGLVCEFSRFLSFSLQDIHKSDPEMAILEPWLEWKFYRLANVPPRYAYRMLCYAAAATGSKAQSTVGNLTFAYENKQAYLSKGALEHSVVELPLCHLPAENAWSFKDNYVEMSFESCKWSFAAVDAKDSVNEYNKWGVRVNFCICTARVSLEAFFQKTVILPHCQSHGGSRVRTASLITKRATVAGSKPSPAMTRALNPFSMAAQGPGNAAIASIMSSTPTFGEGSWVRQGISTSKPKKGMPSFFSKGVSPAKTPSPKIIFESKGSADKHIQVDSDSDDDASAGMVMVKAKMGVLAAKSMHSKALEIEGPMTAYDGTSDDESEDDLDSDWGQGDSDYEEEPIQMGAAVMTPCQNFLGTPTHASSDTLPLVERVCFHRMCSADECTHVYIPKDSSKYKYYACAHTYNLRRCLLCAPADARCKIHQEQLKRKCKICNPTGTGKCTHVRGGLVVTRLKHHCKELTCSGCEHGRVKKRCADCQPTTKFSEVYPHGKATKWLCRTCPPCPHGKLKKHCEACTPALQNPRIEIPCTHRKKKRFCMHPQCLLEMAPRRRSPNTIQGRAPRKASQQHPECTHGLRRNRCGHPLCTLVSVGNTLCQHNKKKNNCIHPECVKAEAERQAEINKLQGGAADGKRRKK